VTTKYLVKFQSQMAASCPKIIQPERISKLICKLWLYTLIPKIKSISQNRTTCSHLALKFDQIFSCHHFISLWFEILTFAINNLQWLLLLRPHSQMAASCPKIIQPERISKLICKLWLYTLIPKIKSISQNIVK
jgi:hypothetical protein